MDYAAGGRYKTGGRKEKDFQDLQDFRAAGRRITGYMDYAARREIENRRREKKDLRMSDNVSTFASDFAPIVK